MLVIAVLTIIAFAWLYNPNQMNKLGGNTVARIYGKGLTQADIDRQVRNFQLARAMGQFDLIGDLIGMAQTERQAVENFIFNLLVLQHESHALNVKPTDEQIVELMKGLPVFQTNGQYDPRKYEAFVQEQLGPRGFTEQQLTEVAKDALRVQRVKEIVTAPVSVSEAEVTEALRVFQKMDLQIVQFPEPDESKVTVTDEEIKAFTEKNRAELVSPETRVVKYVEFTLPAAQASLTGKDKVDATQKLWDTAGTFAEQAAAAKSFEEAAKAAGLEVKESSEFDHGGATKIEMQLRQLANIQGGGSMKAFAPQAFLLSEQRTVSDAIQDGDKFYVLKLEKVIPERPLTAEEIRPIADVKLRAAKLAKLGQEQGLAAVAALRNAVAGGKTLADAATAAGLKVESVPGVIASNPQGQNVPVGILKLALLMEPAQLSNYLASEDGSGAAIYLAARAPLDQPEAELAQQKEEVRKGLLESKEQLLFLSWLNSALEAAKLVAVGRPGAQ